MMAQVALTRFMSGKLISIIQIIVIFVVSFATFVHFRQNGAIDSQYAQVVALPDFSSEYRVKQWQVDALTVDPQYGAKQSQVDALTVDPAHTLPFLEVGVTSRTQIPRSVRFPSVNERVRIYMSNFYNPPCEEGKIIYNSEGTIHYDENNYPYRELDKMPDDFTIDARAVTVSDPEGNFILTVDSLVKVDELFMMEMETMKFCRPDINFEFYCGDARIFLEIAGRANVEELTAGPPFLVTMGDQIHSNYDNIDMPFFSKIRRAASGISVEEATSQGQCVENKKRKMLKIKRLSGMPVKSFYSPVIIPLETPRHYEMLPKVHELDCPWEDKKNMAVWRGAFTGRTPLDESLDFEGQCNMNVRCHFVLTHRKSKLIDAGTHFKTFLSLHIDNEHQDMYKGTLEMKKQLKYKAIIVIEGNDMATSLKWVMYSNSVVLMPRPTITSYFMEELLEPWVHYIPLKDDASDAEEQMQWVIDNDMAAKEIAIAGHLFVHDLMFHKDAIKDHDEILKEIARRYLMHFK